MLVSLTCSGPLCSPSSRVPRDSCALSLFFHRPARGGGARATRLVSPEWPGPTTGRPPLAPWHHSSGTTEGTPVLSPLPCSLPGSGAPRKLGEPSLLCTSHLLAFPTSQDELAAGRGGLSASQGWQRVGSPPRRAAQASRLRPNSSPGSGLTAEPGRRRVHTCGPGPGAPSTPGERPPARPGRIPPAGPRQVPLGPSCSPGALVAGTHACAPARGCSAPKRSPPARTGREGASELPFPRLPPASSTCPHHSILGAPGAPHTGPAPASCNPRSLTSLSCPDRPSVSSISTSSSCWLSLSTGGRLQLREGSRRTRWTSPYPCPSLPQPRSLSPASASTR